MPTHNLNLRYDDAAAIVVSKTAGAEQNVEETIPADSTDLLLVGLTIDVSALKSIYIKSDKALTLETNSSSAADETLTLGADTPIIWYDGMPAAMKPFQQDVTALYVTEGASVDANLIIKTLQDPTP
jgi:hypothetical protein